jgi:hypothetical protein
MRGRRPTGPEYVDHLEGSDQAKLRLRVILETIAGTRRVQEACAKLNVCEQRFHQLRETTLTAALAGLEPGKPGRRARTLTPAEQEVQALEEQLAANELELRTALARVEIALAVPRVLHEPPASKAAPSEHTEAPEKKSADGAALDWAGELGRRGPRATTATVLSDWQFA